MVYFKEILPNPAGDDAANEWIKLVNTSESGVNLSGWTIKDAGGKIYTLSVIADPKTEIVLGRSTTGIALNNDRETLTLTNEVGGVVDTISYVNASDDEVIVSERFLLKEETDTEPLRVLEKLSGEKDKNIISGNEATAVLVALTLAIVAGILMGHFAKRKIENEA